MVGMEVSVQGGLQEILPVAGKTLEDPVQSLATPGEGPVRFEGGLDFLSQLLPVALQDRMSGNPRDGAKKGIESHGIVVPFFDLPRNRKLGLLEFLQKIEVGLVDRIVLGRVDRTKKGVVSHDRGRGREGIPKLIISKKAGHFAGKG